MNKKFFAALMASGMLMGSPMGVLAAEEMVEVENGSVPGTDVEQASEVKLDEVNFPDKNFRTAVATAYANVGNETGTAKVAVADGTMLKTEDLAKILTLSSAAKNSAAPIKKEGTTGPTETSLTDAVLAADYFGTTPSAQPFKDLTGIEYLTGLQYLSILNSPNLKVADLTDNEELVYVAIAPLTAAGDTLVTPLTFGATTPTPTQDIQGSDLYSITLPEETANLETLIVAGANQLTTLDLSAYDSLTDVNLQFNELAQLNVEGCSSIENLNVSGNDLTGLDVSTLKALKTLIATDNNLYELELPSGKSLTTVNVSDNKLPSIDVSSVRGLTNLIVSDNRLESIDVSNNSSLTGLNVAYNHLATLDLSDNTTLAGVAIVTPQYLYANTTDGGIDLASYDENFQAETSDKVGWIANSSGATNHVMGGSITKAGVFEFGSDIKPAAATTSAAATTGIFYDYGIGDTAATNNMRVNIVQADLMNRLYNPNSGEHFYTADLNEKDTLVKLGWQAEGIGWVAPQENYPTQPVEAGAAVFRLYNPNAGDHHYTSDSKEKDTLVRAGWNYEGVGWYSGKKHDDDLTTNPTSSGKTIKAYTIEVYREYNPNAKEAGAHNYTTSENENDTLVALGWLDEGIGWWALK